MSRCVVFLAAFVAHVCATEDQNPEWPTAVSSPRYCPVGCSVYSSDGCNNCTCDDAGSIRNCTRRFCDEAGVVGCLKGNRSPMTSTTPSPSTAPATSTHSSLTVREISTDVAVILPSCPSPCRVFRPDTCNECLCSSEGLTLWCTHMDCSPSLVSSPVSTTCIEFLDGTRREDTSVAPTVRPVIISTEASIRSTPNPMKLTTQSAPLGPARFPEDEAVSCWPPDQLVDQCPQSCSLAMVNCRICSCSRTTSAIEWCTPCIDRCTVMKVWCLDLIFLEAKDVTPHQLISGNISELKVAIHYNDNTVTHSLGPVRCTGNCTITTSDHSSSSHTQRIDFVATPSSGIAPIDPPPSLVNQSQRHASVGTSSSMAAEETSAKLTCTQLLNLNGEGVTHSDVTHSCPFIAMGCFFCECDERSNVVKKCGVWETWEGRTCSGGKHMEGSETSSVTIFTQLFQSRRFSLPACVRDRRQFDDQQLRTLVTLDGQSILTWTLMHYIHHLWHHLAGQLPQLPSLSLPFPSLPSLPKWEGETGGGLKGPNFVANSLQKIVKLSLQFFYSLTASELQ